MGKPTVTLPSDQLRGRMAWALYRTLNLTDCVARDRAEYVAIAARLGRDRAWRAEVAAAIAARSAALWEDKETVRALAPNCAQYWVSGRAKHTNGAKLEHAHPRAQGLRTGRGTEPWGCRGRWPVAKEAALSPRPL